MNDFIARLSSRKFLLAIGTIIGLVGNKQYGEAAAVAVAYFAAEGAVDFRTVKNGADAASSELDDFKAKLDELAAAEGQ